MRALFLVCLIGLEASAQAAGADQQPAPSARLFVTGGAASRSLEQPGEGATGAVVRGFSPFVAHASGAIFFSRWFGLDGELRGGGFMASENGARVLLPSFSAAALPSFRWSPSGSVDLEAQVGWGLAGLPALSLSDPARPAGALRVTTGPVAGVVVGLEPAAWLSAQLFARGQLGLGGPLGLGVNAGAQLRLGALSLFDRRWGVGLTYELAWARAGADASALTLLEHRVGLGFAMLDRPAPTPPPVAPPEPPRDALRANLTVQVVTAGSAAPVPGATIEVEGRAAAAVDERGQLTLGDLAPGTLTVRASARGHRAGARPVTLRAGDSLAVTLELTPLTGPGRITGRVLSGPDAPLEGVLLRAGGGAAVKTDATGAFALEGVGPGLVRVTAAMTGFEKGEELVQVPPGSSAALTLTLRATSVRARATVKGVVVGADGAVPGATVRLLEKKLSVKSKADGRFELEVPGGRYTFSVQAPGYVTQTRPLELADGDQAIFHVELERAR